MKLSSQLCVTLVCLISLAVAGCQSNQKQGNDQADQGTSQELDQARKQAKAQTPQGTTTDTTAPGPPPPGGPSKPGTYTQAELQKAVRNFADQYRKVMSNVADSIINQTDDLAMRRRAFQTKLDGSTAIYDIAADPLPANAMLNSMVMVTLQANVLKRHGDELFGKFHPKFQKRTEFLQESIFRVGAKVMSSQQRTDLLNMTKAWSQANPEQLDIYYVQLDDLPGLQSDVSATQLVGNLTNLPGEFLNTFNPFAKTQDAASQAATLAERMSWLAPRLMILAQWRAQALIYDTLAATQVRGLLGTLDRITEIATNLPQVIDQQRQALFNDLSQNEGTLTHLLSETRTTIDTVSQVTDQANTLVKTGDTLANSTDQLVQSVDQVVKRLHEMQKLAAKTAEKNKPAKPPEPGRPFDITEYTQALNSLNTVVNDTNTLVKSLDQATAQDALDARLNVVQGRIAGLIWLTGGVVLGVALLIILAVKFIPSRRDQSGA